MAGISDEKRTWVKAMLGVDLPNGEDEQGGIEGEDSQVQPMRGKKPGTSAKTASTSKSVQPVPENFPQQFQAAKSGWSAAMDDVDGQISELQKAMRASPDEEIRDIAEFGLNGVTGGFKVMLMTYMMELGDGTNAAALHKSGANLLGAVADFRTLLDKDEQIAVMDDNPFNCVVSVRDTLGPALTALEAAVKHGLGQ